MMREANQVLERLRAEEKRLCGELNWVQKDCDYVQRMLLSLRGAQFIDYERARAKMKAIMVHYPTRKQEDFLSFGAGMAAVPLAFRESVCATLGASSRIMLKRLSDGAPMRKFDGPWSKVAHDMKIRSFKLRVFFDGKDEVSYNEDDVRYNYRENQEEIKKAKYSTCNNLNIITHNAGGAMGKKGDLPTLLRRTQIETLTMMQTNYFDNFFAYISPWYLKFVEISHCKFKSASPLSCWLKKVLGNKCLSKFMVSNNSVEEPVQVKYNLEDEVYNLLAKRDEFELIVHSQGECIGRTPLPISAYLSLLEYRIVSKEGRFTRRIRVIDCYDREEEMRAIEAVKEHYNFWSYNTLQHAYCQAEARVSYD
uniref:Tyrosine-protein phosphatase domain-containing protein n=1 Tax=Steinernema glaseri TaxID=37863 RepID=A0A1I7YS51_9BILA